MARRRKSSKPKYEIKPHAFQAADLQKIVGRFDRIDTDIEALKQDRKHLMQEAKRAGFHPSMLTKVLTERKLDATKRSDRYEVLDMYRSALGMLADTPLGEAAAAKDAKKEKRTTDIDS